MLGDESANDGVFSGFGVVLVVALGGERTGFQTRPVDLVLC